MSVPSIDPRPAHPAVGLPDHEERHRPLYVCEGTSSVGLGLSPIVTAHFTFDFGSGVVPLHLEMYSPSGPIAASSSSSSTSSRRESMTISGPPEAAEESVKVMASRSQFDGKSRTGGKVKRKVPLCTFTHPPSYTSEEGL